MKSSIHGVVLASLVLALTWSGVPTLHAQHTAHAEDASKASGSVLSTHLPRRNAIVKGTVLSLSWDRYPGAAYYYLQFWFVRAAGGHKASGYPALNIAERLTGTHYNLDTQSMPSGTYHWRVAAAGASGSLISAWTPENTVALRSRVQAPLPTRVTLAVIQPGADTVSTEIIVPFTWHPVPGAASYALQIWLDHADRGQHIAADSILDFAARATGTRYSLNTRLMPRGTYRWRMAAANASGSQISAWTVARTLILAAPVPPAPTPTVPPTSTPLPPTSTPLPPTATLTNTPVPPTMTSTPTATPIPPTVTATHMPTQTPLLPTNTPVPPTITPTNTAVPPTATNTPIKTVVSTNTATSTSRPTATATSVAPTATATSAAPSATRTETPVLPTATRTPLPPTSTSLPPTATRTPLPPTSTSLPTTPPTTTPTPTNPVPAQHKTEVEPDTFSFGSTIVSAFQVDRIFDGGASNIGFATSTDGGKSFTNGFLPGTTTFATPEGIYGRVSDPSVAFDAKHGVWLISYLGLFPTGNTSEVDVLVSRSTDGGLTWSNPFVVKAGGHFNDKTWTVCDNTASSPFFGHCYTEFDDSTLGDLIQMSTSGDGGQTWGAALPTGNNAHGLGGQPLVQPNGTVIVPILGFTSSSYLILSFISTDGGVSWSNSVEVTAVAFHAPSGGIRAGFPLPSAENDASGKVYVVWSDCRFEPGCTASDLVLSTSTDGINWSPVTRILLDPIGSGVDHFIPGLAVDRSTSDGSAHLVVTFYYYPAASCTTSTCQLDVGFSTSADGGATWTSNTQISGPMSLTWLANTSQGYMVGDYISTSFVGGPAFAAFAVASSPTGTTFNEAIFTVKVD